MHKNASIQCEPSNATVTENSNSFADAKVGQVFTPLAWAEWAIQGDVFQRWLDGARILDPTGGNGAFIEAFISLAISKRVTISQSMLRRLRMIEIDQSLCSDARNRIASKYGISVPKTSIICDDFFAVKRQMADCIVGNPPWCNFTDLPTAWKTNLKPLFIDLQLVSDQRSVLWGGSRVDLAALTVAKSLLCHCVKDGIAIFYIPLSIFLNDGAHSCFRDLASCSQGFRILELHDLTARKAFNVGTRYGFVRIANGGPTEFPIRFVTHDKNGNEKSERATPIGAGSNALVVGKRLKSPAIEIDKSAIPRQGVNTCGANSCFFFDSENVVENESHFEVHSGSRPFRIEKELLLPLIMRRNFHPDKSGGTHRFVFMPHQRMSGKPLPQEDLMSRFPYAWEYLESIETKLRARKGKMLSVHINKGSWWALLGVGPYTFRKYKIVWESYGKSTFHPRLFTGDWIPNQSLQAYMAFEKSSEAKATLEAIESSNIEEHLLASRNEGTASWAQPGRMKAFFTVRPS